MSNVIKARVTALYPENNYAVTESEQYGSVTFSLDKWEDQYPPEVGDSVILKSVTKRDQGWRAKAAAPLTPENESHLLPSVYPDTVMGRLLQKWDPQFYFSVKDSEWERFIKERNLTRDELIEVSSGEYNRIFGNGDTVNERIRARAFLVLLGMYLYELPFSLPSRGETNTFIGDKDGSIPFFYTTRYTLGKLCTLEKVSDQLLEFIVDLVMFHLRDLLEKHAVASTYDATRYRHWILKYTVLLPTLVNAVEERFPQLAKALVDLYNLDVIYGDYYEGQPFAEMLEKVSKVNTVEDLIEQMEARIRSAKHGNVGVWSRGLKEYWEATRPTYYSKGSWKDKVWLRALRFMVEQQAPYEVFDLEVLVRLLVQKSFANHPQRWTPQEKQDMLKLITGYLVLTNSSWVINDEHSLSITEWVLHGGHSDSEALREQAPLYRSRRARR